MWLAIAVGGAAGASLRYLFSRALAPWSYWLPMGTLASNVVASLLLGAVTALAATGRLGPAEQALLGTGLAGGLSTYSTFAFETLALLDEGDHKATLANIAANVVGGLAAGLAGFTLAQGLI